MKDDVVDPGFEELADNIEGVALDDFYAYMLQSNHFIFTPTRELWPAASVNARLGKIPLVDAKVSIGVGSGPQIGIQKGPPRFAFRTISARAVGAGRDCGDGASAW